MLISGEITIMIDGRSAVLRNAETDDRLNRIFGKLEADCRKNKRSIIKIKINGQKIEWSEKDYFMKESNEALERIEISTTPTEKLLGEAVEEFVRYVPRLSEGLNKVVGLMRSGKVQESLQLYAEAIEGLQWVTSVEENVLFYIQDAGSQNEQEKTSSQRNALNPSRYNGIFSELLDAQESKDWVWFADLLEYELIPLLEEDKNQFHSLFEQF